MASEKTTTVKSSFKDNLKKHKKKIIAATVIVGASTVAVVLGIKLSNSKATKELLLENTTRVLSNKKLPVDDLVTDKTVDISVPSYVRNLPFGQKASAEKIRQACDFGISLKEGQTLVDQYSYTRKCA